MNLSNIFVSSRLLLLLLATEKLKSNAFSLVAPSGTLAKPNLSKATSLLSMSTTEDIDTKEMVTSKGLLKRDRYVATNRFAVRKDQQAKFEKRWATRKSRLAELDGFRYFHLMRRVTLTKDGITSEYDGGDSDKTAQENYVSFTVWDKKSDFSAWRQGDAFKEAHGGNSIGAFISTMVNSALVLRGPPRPAFYDGLLFESVPPVELPETVDGWRSVEADGVRTLPSECFVSLEKFYIPVEQASNFETTWANGEFSLVEPSCDGFVARTLLRRDGQAKGHGMGKVESDEPSYIAATVFKDRSSYEAWAEKQLVAKSKKPDSEKVFYEGTLVIATQDGA